MAVIVSADLWLRAGSVPAASVAAAFDQVLAVAPHIRPNVALMAMAPPLLGVEPGDWSARTWALHR